MPEVIFDISKCPHDALQKVLGSLRSMHSMGVRSWLGHGSHKLRIEIPDSIREEEQADLLESIHESLQPIGAVELSGDGRFPMPDKTTEDRQNLGLSERDEFPEFEQDIDAADQDPETGKPYASKNRRRTEHDPVANVPLEDPSQNMEADLSDQILDLYQKHKQTGQPDSTHLQQARELSKRHYGERLSVHQLERRLAQKRLALRICGGLSLGSITRADRQVRVANRRAQLEHPGEQPAFTSWEDKDNVRARGQWYEKKRRFEDAEREKTMPHPVRVVHDAMQAGVDAHNARNAHDPDNQFQDKPFRADQEYGSGPDRGFDPNTWVVGSNREDGGSSMIYKAPEDKWYYRSSHTGEDRPMKGNHEEAVANARGYFDADPNLPDLHEHLAKLRKGQAKPAGRKAQLQDHVKAVEEMFAKAKQSLRGLAAAAKLQALQQDVREELKGTRPGYDIAGIEDEINAVLRDAGKEEVRANLKRSAQAGAQYPPAQYGAAQTTSTASGGEPAQPKTPAPAGKRWIYDMTSNQWVLAAS